jgi:hypothetical protein
MERLMADFPFTSGLDTLKGSKADDTFTVTKSSDFAATDKVTGGGGNDQIVVKTDQQISDAQFAGVSQVQTITVASGAQGHIDVGAKAAAAGINFIDGTNSSDSLFVDASAYTNAAGITIKSGVGAFITGSKFGDTIQFTASLLDVLAGQGSINGGAGNDTLQVAFAGETLQDTDLGAFSSVERLLITGDNAHIAVGAKAAAAGITLIEGANITNSLTVDASLYGRDGLTFKITGGNNVFTGSAFNDIVQIASGAFTSSNTLSGGKESGGFGDVIEVRGDGKAALVAGDSGLIGVSGFETLRLANAPAATLTLGEVAATAGLENVDGGLIAGAFKVDAGKDAAGISIFAGVNTANLTGGVGDDRFLFTSAALTAADKIDGGGVGDTDQIVILDKAAVTDAALAGVKNVELLTVSDEKGLAADYTGAKVTLGASSVKAGITTVDNDTDYGLTVDASARGTTTTVFHGGGADDVFFASTAAAATSGGRDTFAGGAGDDSLRIKLAAFDGADFFFGGTGSDEIRILDSANAKDSSTAIVDGDFSGTFSVERLVFDGTGAQNVTLGTNAANAGIAVVDASKVAGGLTLDAKNDGGPLDVTAGSGKDSIQLGAGDDDVFIAQSKLTKDDTIDGGSGFNLLHFTEAAKLTDAAFASLVGKVTNFIGIDLDSSAAKQTVTLGSNFQDFAKAAGNLTEIRATSDSAATSVTFDFSAHNAGYAFNVYGSNGNDIFIGGNKGDSFFAGGGDDLFKYSAANFVQHALIQGQDGQDKILITDAGSGFTILDFNFTGVTTVETLQLGAAKTGFYDLTTGTDFNTSGITTIDASLAGVNVTVSAGASHADLTILAGTKDNKIVAGSGDDTVAIDAKSFDKLDQLDGGSGENTLKFTTGGAVAQAAFAATTDFQFLQLADAGNSVVLTDSLLSGNAPVALDGGFFRIFDFAVLGGKGNDTVDLSKLTNGHVGVVAGAGTDTIIGSAQDDSAIFNGAADLTGADKFDGGAGFDRVIGAAGTYSSDQLKGMKNVEAFELFSADPAKGSSVTIKNDFLATLTPDAQGLRSFQVLINEAMKSNDTVDASGITSTTSGIVIASGGGDDTLTGGAGNDGFTFSDDGNGHFQLDSGDVVRGGGGLDTITLTNTDTQTTTLTDADLAGVTGVEVLKLTSPTTGNPVTVTLGDEAVAAGILEVDASALQGDLTLNANPYGIGGQGIKVEIGVGTDDITLTDHDDVLGFGDGDALGPTDVIKGGGGTDRLDIHSSGPFNDANLKGVTQFEQISLSGAATKLILGTNADKNGFTQIDAVQAQQGVTIDGTAMTKGWTITGSSFDDILKGGAGNDVIAGGSGNDFMTGGGGNDIFVFTSAGDSHLETGGSISKVDFILDYNTGDAIDLNSFQIDTGTVVKYTGLSLTEDTADFFKTIGSDIVAKYSGAGLNRTTVYVDTNGSGSFEINQDLVFLVNGDQTGAGALQFATKGSVHPDPLKPELSETDPFTLKDAKAYIDSDFAGASGKDAILLSATKGNYSLTLGGTSENAGLRFIDGSQVTGTLTVNAAGRADPVYIASGSGVNDLTGTAADDIFYFTNAGLAATDKVNGGPDGKLLFTGSDLDTLFITDKAALKDAAFTGVKNVEILEFGPSPLPGAKAIDVTGQSVVLGAKSEAAGIGTIINDYATGLTVDASGRTYLVNFTGGIGNDVLIGSTLNNISGHFTNDVFDGGAGDDSFRTKIANFGIQSLDEFNGGAGTDEVRILDSYDGKNDSTKIFDISFQNFTSVERIVFDGTGKQFLTLGTQAEEAGIRIIDASKVTGGLTLDGASGGPDFGNSLNLILGSGADTITLGGAANQNDVYMLSKNLTAADKIDFGYTQSGSNLHLTDNVKLTDNFFAGLNIVNLAHILLDGTGAGQSFVAGANFNQFRSDNDASFPDTLGTIQATSTDKNTSFTFDFTAYTGSDSLSVIGSAGNDVFKAGSVQIRFDGQGGNDSFQFKAADFGGKIDGGDGNDEIVLLDASGLALGSALADTRFADVDNVETLRLAATKTGEYHIEIGANADNAGIVTVDASQAGVFVDIDAGLSAKGHVLIGGAKANFLSGGSGDDVMVLDAKTFGTDDGIDGGSSANGDILKFSTGGVIAATPFTSHVSGIEKLQFSDAGNTLVATDDLFSQSDNNAKITLPDGTTRTFDFAILGGKGSDTVDLSAIVSSGSVAIIGNGGADKFTGNAYDNTFIFPLAGDLTGADVVKGGAGNDTVMIVAGSYGADAFKNLTSIETIAVLDPASDSDSTLKLGNDVFKNADKAADGTTSVAVVFDAATTGHHVLDASAVTLATASVQAAFGAGDDTFIGGAGADVATFQDDGGSFFQLTAFDSVDGGLGKDTLALESDRASSILLDTALAGVRHVEVLKVVDANAASKVSVTLLDNALSAGISTVDATGAHNVSVDASGFGGDLTVLAGLGTKDTVTFGSGNGTVVYGDGAVLDATDTLTGGTAIDTIRFDGDTTVTDSQFKNVTAFERIELRDGTFDLTLAGFAKDTGISAIDATHSGGLSLNAQGFGNSLRVDGSQQGDTIVGGSAGDVIIGGGGADDLTGKGGADIFTYGSAGDSVLLSSGSLGLTDSIEDFLKSAGDRIDLTAFDLSATITNKTGIVTGLTGLGAGVFAGQAGVSVAEIGADTFIFADTDKNGAFDYSSDLVIQLVGTHAATDLISGGILLTTI